ncbi:MAG: hypothetical protein A2Y94_08645 [Caldithrix sp. RBG_13_44_9]|nr:MAG: hypothetical protein A2Y94_08645 [Caldithrix sp. RBG_13_44_9]
MIKNVIKFVILVNLLFTFSLFSHTFSWQADTTLKFGVPGNTILFHTYLTNTTADQESLRVIRTTYQFPVDWTSSFCVGGISGICYAPFFDTIPDPVILNASETLELAIDVQTSVTPDQGELTVKIENWSNPSDFLTKLFTASTNPNALVEDQSPVTSRFRLYANYPNPFNPETTIRYFLDNPARQNIQLIIYNSLRQKVQTLVNTIQPAGEYEITWDGRDHTGQPVPSGIYFSRLISGNQAAWQKMILIR